MIEISYLTLSQRKKKINSFITEIRDGFNRQLTSFRNKAYNIPKGQIWLLTTCDIAYSIISGVLVGLAILGGASVGGIVGGIAAGIIVSNIMKKLYDETSIKSRNRDMGLFLN
ncbi:MAG: hypothetical protein LBG88_02035 [Christensenellaceae bacterium]|nr:hypothetical protein [Christensenellaceae bacterium]